MPTLHTFMHALKSSSTLAFLMSTLYCTQIWGIKIIIRHDMVILNNLIKWEKVSEAWAGLHAWFVPSIVGITYGSMILEIKVWVNRGVTNMHWNPKHSLWECIFKILTKFSGKLWFNRCIFDLHTISLANVDHENVHQASHSDDS